MFTQAEWDEFTGSIRRDERQRVRQLAIDHDAIYTQCSLANCPDDNHTRPFADLLDGDGDE